MKTKVILLTACAFLCVASVKAQFTLPVVSVSQFFQDIRIKQGLKSGELTEREATRLQKEQHRIRRKKVKYQKDGVLTAREKYVLRNRQHKADTHIYRQKHDRQRAW